MVENLRLIGGCLFKQVAVQQLKDLTADGVKFALDLGAIFAGKSCLIVVAFGSSLFGSRFKRECFVESSHIFKFSANQDGKP